MFYKSENMSLSFLLNKENAKKFLVDLAIYSTFLDVLVFLGTITSSIFKIEQTKILLPINIGITIVISTIIMVWLYLKISEVLVLIKSFLKKNFEFLTRKRLIFDNGKIKNVREIKIKIFRYSFLVSI